MSNILKLPGNKLLLLFLYAVQIVAQNNYWTAIFYEHILGFIILVHRTLWFEELAIAAESRLALASGDSTVQMLNVKTERPLHTLKVDRSSPSHFTDCFGVGSAQPQTRQSFRTSRDRQSL